MLGCTLGDFFRKLIGSPWVEIKEKKGRAKECSQAKLSLKKKLGGREQGDQIGRNFAHWTIVFFGRVIENYIISPNLLATIFHGKIYLLALTKVSWATSWAIFSQTHLVTLAANVVSKFKRS
jgi:hypothetical protein